MIEGDMVLKIQDGDKAVDVEIKEGEIFLLPPEVPHSPQRSAGSIGLVIERKRNQSHTDGMIWYCQNCNHKLYEEKFPLTNIMTQMQGIIIKFYASEELRTCDNCGTVMPPRK